MLYVPLYAIVSDSCYLLTIGFNYCFQSNQCNLRFANVSHTHHILHSSTRSIFQFQNNKKFLVVIVVLLLLN